MDKTPFAGFTRLDPGDRLGEDNASFQSVNPTIADRLLRRALQHNHTGQAGLDPATVAPELATDDSQGVIPADTTILVGYTLVDEIGGETVVSPTAVVSTGAPLAPPDDMPSLSLDTTSGTLPVGSYAYAVSYTDGTGGETPVGPLVSIDRDPGPANASVIVSGLSTVVSGNPAAVGWRLYRSRDGEEFYFLAEGTAAMDTVTDDGGLCADCTGTPLSEDRNTTMGTNALLVTVPDSPEAQAATAIRIYATSTDFFTTPALLDELDPSQIGFQQTYLTLDVTDGQPPDASQSLPQPSQIDAATELANFYWRTPVPDVASLPPDGNQDGDVRMTLDTRTLYGWSDTSANWAMVTIGVADGGIQPRQDYSANAPSVDPGNSYAGTMTVAPTYKLLRVQLPQGNARVRLYSSLAARTADASRDVNTPPTGDHGVMLDLVFGVGETSLWMTPPVDGYSTDGSDSIYFRVTNNAASQRSLDVILTAVRLEATA